MPIDFFLLRQLLEAMPDAVLLVDDTGCIILANDAVRQIFGYEPDELLGMSIEKVVPPEHRRRHEGYRQGLDPRSGSRPMGTGLVVEGVRKDGSRVPLDVKLAPMKHERQRYVAAVARDISHIVKLQDQLAHYADDLEDALSRSEQRRLALEALNQDKNRLLGVAAHDLRNPLAALRAFADILESGLLGGAPSSHQPLVREISRSIDYMSTLVDELLDWSAIQSGKVELRLADVDLADLVAGVVAVEELAARARAVHISTHVDADLDRARLDENKIKQVVHNLVSNAVRFSPEGGTVELSLRRAADTVELSVRDHGPGVPDDFRDRLFQPFERSADQDSKGTGLGLAIVHQIVDHHGGSIEVQRPAGGGARFIVTLPMDSRPLDQAAVAS